MGFKSNSMKRLIPFIPIIGIFLVLCGKKQYIYEENYVHFHLSAFFQAIYIYIYTSYMIQPNIGPKWLWMIIFPIIGFAFIGLMYFLVKMFTHILNFVI